MEGVTVRYKVYTVKVGDTVQNIAQQTLGDLSRWQEIVQYNNLKYPYITDLTTEHTVTLGDTLIIPEEVTSEDLANVALRKQDKDVIASYALGRDLDLIGNYRSRSYKERDDTDELFSLSNKDRDLATNYGHQNLIQAIIMRLSTKSGTMPLHPEYGTNLHNLLGQRLTYDLLDKISVEIRRTINEEPRVSDNHVGLKVVDNNQVNVTLHVNPIDTDEQLDIVLNMDSEGSVVLV